MIGTLPVAFNNMSTETNQYIILYVLCVFYCVIMKIPFFILPSPLSAAAVLPFDELRAGSLLFVGNEDILSRVLSLSDMFLLILTINSLIKIKFAKFICKNTAKKREKKVNNFSRKTS